MNLSRWIGLFAVGVLLTVCASLGFTQQVPIGTLGGVVRMNESGRPLSRAQVTLENTTTDSNGAPTEAFSVKTDKEGRYVFRGIRAGQYQLSVSTRWHKADKTIISIAEGARTERDISALPLDDSLTAQAPQRIFMPGEAIKFNVTGFTRENRLKIDFIPHRIVDEISSPLEESRDAAGAPSRTVLHSVENRDSEGQFIEMIDCGSAPEGYYVVRVSAGKLEQQFRIMVTKIGLVTLTGDSTLLYVIDLRSGAPIQGAEVFTDKMSAKPLITGADGCVHTADTGSHFLARYEGSIAIDRTEPQQSNGAAQTIYTDRPIYRPGDKINFKGILRLRDGSKYKTPGKTIAHIVIRAPDETDYQKFDVPVSESGSYSGSFTTGEEADPGAYLINASVKLDGSDEQAMGIASVAYYRKPLISAKVETDRPYYVIGDTVKATVSAKYFFGAPAAGTKVKASGFRNPLWFDASAGEDADDQDLYADSLPEGGEYTYAQQGETNEAGKLELQLPTSASEAQEFYRPRDYDYQFSFDVASANGQTATQTIHVPVYQGDVTMQVSGESFIVGEKDSLVYDVVVRSRDAGHAPVPGATISANIGTLHWQAPDATAVFDEKRLLSFKTNDKGEAHIEIPPGVNDENMVRFSVGDSKGRLVTQDMDFYRSDRINEVSDSRPAEFKVTLFKKAYKPGEKGHALIVSNRPGGTALVVVGSSRIQRWITVPITQKATPFDFDFDPDEAPNTFLTAIYVKDKKFRQDQVGFKIERPDRVLSIDVQPEKPSYLPGDTATLKIRTKDWQGRGVPAEVSLAIVDQSVYALREDSTNLKSVFYPRSWNSIQVSYSFFEVYLDAEDKGVQQINVRRKFEDTAYWNPAIQTDANGDATIQAKLPDNLTQWRATAIGITRDTKVGKGVGTFYARRPISAMLEAPRHLIDGDNQRVVVAVSNNSGRLANVSVSLKADGLRLEGASRQIALDDGKVENLDFVVHAESAGPASLVATVTSSAGSDAVEQKIDVMPRGRLDYQSASGEIDSEVVAHLEAPSDADRHFGSLTLSVQPSLLSISIEGLDSLINDPYGCTEQTLDRFVPAILVAKLAKDQHLPSSPKLERIPKVARDSVDRLARMQHKSGAWGWWDADGDDLGMTALVLNGLALARDNGFPIRRINVEKALHSVRAALKTDPSKDEPWRVTAFDRLGGVLALANWRDRSAEVFYRQLELRAASPAELSRMIQIDRILGAPFDAARHEAVEKLKSFAIARDGAAYWGAQGWSGATENTAFAFHALSAEDPADPMIPQIIAYLMRNRRSGAWDSSITTAEALYGIYSYLSKIQVVKGPIVVEASINGGPPHRFSLNPEAPALKENTLSIPIGQLRPGSNEIRLKPISGSGAFYFAELRSYRKGALDQPFSKVPGLEATRSYRLVQPVRGADGKMTLGAGDRVIDSAKSGDIIECKLTIQSKEPQDFVMIEDPTPSNCFVADTAKTPDEWWYADFCGLQTFDDRVALFVRHLKAGTTQITYHLRAEGSGTSHAPPGRAIAMYAPSWLGLSAESRMEVSR